MVEQRVLRARRPILNLPPAQVEIVIVHQDSLRRQFRKRLPTLARGVVYEPPAPLVRADVPLQPRLQRPPLHPRQQFLRQSLVGVLSRGGEVDERGDADRERGGDPDPSPHPGRDAPSPARSSRPAIHPKVLEPRRSSPSAAARLLGARSPALRLPSVGRPLSAAKHSVPARMLSEPKSIERASDTSCIRAAASGALFRSG